MLQINRITTWSWSQNLEGVGNRRVFQTWVRDRGSRNGIGKTADLGITEGETHLRRLHFSLFPLVSVSFNPCSRYQPPFTFSSISHFTPLLMEGKSVSPPSVWCFSHMILDCVTYFAFILDCSLHDNRSSLVLVIKSATSMNFQCLLLPKELSRNELLILSQVI